MVRAGQALVKENVHEASRQAINLFIFLTGYSCP